MGRFIVVLVMAVGCRINDVDYTGKACPCPAGFVCDPASQSCQKTVTPDDAMRPDVKMTIDAGLETDVLFWYHLDSIANHDIAPVPPTTDDGFVHNTADVMVVPGKVGNALHFDGTIGQSVVSFPASGAPCTMPPTITSSFTASAWVQFDAFHDWAGYSLSDTAIMQGTNGGTDGGWGIGATDGCNGISTAAVEIATVGSLRVTRCGTTPLTNGEWYFITGVYDSAVRTLVVYLNGVREDGAMTNTTSVPGVINAATMCPMLGGGSNQSTNLTGSVDEVRVYTRALSDAEVGALYRASGGS